MVKPTPPSASPGVNPRVRTAIPALASRPAVMAVLRREATTRRGAGPAWQARNSMNRSVLTGAPGGKESKDGHDLGCHHPVHASSSRAAPRLHHRRKEVRRRWNRTSDRYEVSGVPPVPQLPPPKVRRMKFARVIVSTLLVVGASIDRKSVV